jgi:hypothetical protein
MECVQDDQQMVSGVFYLTHGHWLSPSCGGQTGQLPVEQHQIGLRGYGLVQQFVRPANLTHHYKPRLFVEEPPQGGTHGRLVIRNQDSHFTPNLSPSRHRAQFETKT